ncbi:MAG: hypothetical protein BWY41_01531 [Candidatus Atribacteria bacterium ADurb.Bin276]|uniref:Uncharacterized protein n=1 Tax=Candidatus Atribacter allofermentans TaxID=1852833 RepID=A0A1V5SPV9_9BACT|nr:MAG: hypothetical protein BWY41_01531 [Candidatus Atribacteria bacterium ADurb.Bin276]
MKKWQENVINVVELVAVITVKDQARKTIQDMENPAMIPAFGVMGVGFANGAAEEVNAENFKFSIKRVKNSGLRGKVINLTLVLSIIKTRSG